MPYDFDPVLEMALIERQAREAVARKIAATHSGEAWKGLDDAKDSQAERR